MFSNKKMLNFTSVNNDILKKVYKFNCYLNYCEQILKGIER